MSNYFFNVFVHNYDSSHDLLTRSVLCMNYVNDLWKLKLYKKSIKKIFNQSFFLN